MGWAEYSAWYQSLSPTSWLNLPHQRQLGSHSFQESYRERQMFSMGRKGGSETGVKPQRRLTVSGWTWDCPTWQKSAQWLTQTLRSRRHLVLHNQGFIHWSRWSGVFTSPVSLKLYGSGLRSLPLHLSLRWTKKKKKHFTCDIIMALNCRRWG